MSPALARSHTLELLDQLAGVAPEVLCANLRDIARYNHWLGANRLMHRLVLSMIDSACHGLDIGAGAGDFVDYAARTGKSRWVALDASAAVLRCGSRSSRQESAPTCPAVAASGLALPFPDGSFDIVTCAQTLHHLEPTEASALLRECARVARHGVIVVDLTRSYVTLLGVWLLTRLTTRNPMTRADGVQSARRAYTPDEARALAQVAGWPAQHTHMQSHGPARWSMTLSHQTRSAYSSYA